MAHFLRVRFQVIDAADAVEEVELQTAVFFQKAAHLEQVGGIDHGEGIDRLEVLRLDARAELLFEKGDDVGGGHASSPSKRTTEDTRQTRKQTRMRNCLVCFFMSVFVVLRG